MKNIRRADKAFLSARNVALEEQAGQDKNRLWWESLPMTYVDWDSDERIPKTKEDFLELEAFFLSSNPCGRGYENWTN